MKLIPMKNKVLLKVDAAPTTTESGLVLPRAVDQAHKECEVIEVGPLAESVLVGDKVLIGLYMGQSVDIEPSGNYVIVEETDILGILEG